MGVVVRQSVITSIISYLGVAIGYVNLLYLYPKFLATEQIGLLRTIQDAALLFAPFAQFGIGHSVLRFFPGLSKGPDKGNSFMTFVLLFSILGYGVFLIVFFSLGQPLLNFFQDKAPQILSYTDLILWLTFLIMVVTVMEFYSRSLLRVVFPNLLRELGLRLWQMIIVLLYFLSYISFQEFLILSVVSYLVVFLLLTGYLFIFGGFRLNLDFKTLGKGKFKEILTFSSLSFVGTSASIIISKIDSLMVAGMKGLHFNAIYTTAYYMATVIEIPKRAITQTTTTLLAKAFEEENTNEVRRIYQRTSLNQALIGLLALIGVWANLGNIFQIMPNGSQYATGSLVVMIVGLAKLVDMAFGPSSEIIVMSKFYWFNIVVITILAVSGLSLNYILIPAYGILGAAVATAISVTLFNSVKCIFIYAKLRIQPFTVGFLSVLLIGVITIVINEFLPQVENAYLDMAYRSVLLTLVFSALALLLKVSDEGTKLFHSVLRRVGLR